MLPLNDNCFEQWLEQEYGHYFVSFKDFGDGRYGAVIKMLFTYNIIVGKIGDKDGFFESYFYPNEELADESLEQWDGIGDAPIGWLRHTPSNRRRKNGNPQREEVIR